MFTAPFCCAARKRRTPYGVRKKGDFMNFDRLKKVNEFYDGAAKKYAVAYNDDIYMIKYPAKTDIKNDLNTEYSNSSFSEYISCHIINELQIPGVEAQQTLLGESNGRIAVACKDFTDPYNRLVKFNMIQNADISSEASGRHPVLQDVLQTYQTLPQLQNPAFIERFWDTFAIDTLLGNFDRHAGNWGFLNDVKAGELRLAPIYDCGSCLYPALSVSKMQGILNSEEEIQKRIFEFPQSAFLDKETGKKINYGEFIKVNTNNSDMMKAFDKLSSVIDFNKINQVIDQTPYLSDTQKGFYSTMIQRRYDSLIKPFVHTRQQQNENPIEKYCNKITKQNDISLDEIQSLLNER